MDIVRTKAFDRDIKRVGASDEDVEALMAEIAQSPTGGDVIKGLGGARKVRFALKSRKVGKSGGARAIYLWVQVDDVAYLLKAYAKNEKADLSPADKAAIVRLVKELET